jgi:hypothetical protein
VHEVQLPLMLGRLTYARYLISPHKLRYRMRRFLSREMRCSRGQNRCVPGPRLGIRPISTLTTYCKEKKNGFTPVKKTFTDARSALLGVNASTSDACRVRHGSSLIGRNIETRLGVLTPWDVPYPTASLGRRYSDRCF